VGGASYSDVRTAAFMGYSLIALASGAKRRDLERARQTGDAALLPYGGYLARIHPDIFSDHLAALLPERMKGRDFLARALSIDPATKVNPARNYRVRACTQHPIHENSRVNQFRKELTALEKAKNPAARNDLLLKMGELMVQSHHSYGDCGLGEPVTDSLVMEILKAGPDRCVYGAKITGGGSGGTGCALADGKKGLCTVQEVASRVLGKTNPFICLGSSEGCRWEKPVQ